jgi:hypothetical protein
VTGETKIPAAITGVVPCSSASAGLSTTAVSVVLDHSHARPR